MTLKCRHAVKGDIIMEISNLLPTELITFPPASSTNNTPAEVSQLFKPNSQNPSNLPHATYARSKAAEPSLLIDLALKTNFLKLLILFLDKQTIYMVF